MLFYIVKQKSDLYVKYVVTPFCFCNAESFLVICVCVMWRLFLCEQPLVLPPSLKENILDFGVRSATDTSSITFVVVNSNPIEVRSCSILHVLLHYT